MAGAWLCPGRHGAEGARSSTPWFSGSRRRLFHTGWSLSLGNLKARPAPTVTLFHQHGHTYSKATPIQTRPHLLIVPLSMGQAFKYKSLWGHTYSNHHSGSQMCCHPGLSHGDTGLPFHPRAVSQCHKVLDWASLFTPLLCSSAGPSAFLILSWPSRRTTMGLPETRVVHPCHAHPHDIPAAPHGSIETHVCMPAGSRCLYGCTRMTVFTPVVF